MSCYCNQGREVGLAELQCSQCSRWFHARCLTDRKASTRCVPFMINYVFHCKNCTPNQQEYFTQRQANFSQMCVTALANLSHAQRTAGQAKRLFSRDHDIIPYLDANWEKLTSMPRRVKVTWHQTIQKTMIKDNEVFSHVNIDSDEQFGLVEPDLSKIGPSYDTLCSAVSGPSKSSTNGTGAGKAGPAAKPGERKRKVDSSGQTAPGTKRTKSGVVAEPAVASTRQALQYPSEHPYSKDGYRYHLVETDVHAPFRKEFEDRHDLAGKPIPSYFYRVVHPPLVTLSGHQRAQQLRVHNDRLSVTGDKGYSVVHGSHSVRHGAAYFEVTIVDQPAGSHARIGWSQQLGCVQAPVGYDKFSYAYRSRKGTRFHASIGKHYGEAYGQGDTVGFLIELAEDNVSSLPPDHKELPLVRVRNMFYFEEKDNPATALKSLKEGAGNRITFFKNGVSQGVAYSSVYKGEYFPAISLYKNITVNANFGPKFRYPPAGVECYPVSDRSLSLQTEQCLSDIQYFIENEGRLSLG